MEKKNFRLDGAGRQAETGFPPGCGVQDYQEIGDWMG
jgi:hypothetical protein